MELRKKVKRPQRYEPELDDAGRGDRYIPPLNRPIFRTSFVEYNPNMRRAAFPTLDHAQNAPSEQDRATRLSDPKSVQQADTVSIAERMLSQTKMAKSRTSAPTEARTEITTASVVEDENLAASNCDQNPVYASNLQLSQKWSQRTEDDWNIQEMETSDEEELQEETMGPGRAKPTSAGSTPAWEDLTATHRLEIVSTLAEYSSRSEAMQQLQLSLAQRREVVAQLARRCQEEVMENEKIAAFQHGLLQSFLNEEASLSGQLSPEAYRKLLEEHIYQSVGEEGYSLTTTKELAKARAYLKSAGFAPWLAGRWVEASPFTSSSYPPPPMDGRALFVQSGGVQQQSVPRQQQTLPVRRRFGDMEALKGKGVHSSGVPDTGSARPSGNDYPPRASDERVQASAKEKRLLPLFGRRGNGEEKTQ